MDEDKLHLDDIMNMAISEDIEIIVAEIVNHINNFIDKYHCNNRTVMYAVMIRLLEILIDNEGEEKKNVRNGH